MRQREAIFDYVIVGGGLLLALMPFAVHIITYDNLTDALLLLGWTLFCFIGIMVWVHYRQRNYLATLEHELAERKRAEDRFAKIFHNSPIPISISTLHTHEVIDINDAALAQIGYTREEYTHLDSILEPGWMDKPKNTDAARTLLKDGSVHRLEMQYRPKSGELCDALVFIEKIDLDDTPCKLMFTLDITDLKNARERLLQTTSELQSIVRAFPDLYVRLSLDGKGTISDYMSGDVLAFGVPPEQFLNQKLHDVLPEVVAETVQTALDSLDQIGSTTSVEYDLVIRRRTRHFEMRMVKESDDQVLAIARDITERKRAEIDQQETKMLFSQVVENMREVMLVRDLRERRLVYVSDLFTSLWNTNGAQAQNINQTGSMLDDVHPDDVERVKQAISRQKSGEADDFEFRIKHPDNGVTRWMRMRNVPISDDDGEVYRVAVMTEDITERKDYERAQSEADAIFRTLAETLPATISIINEDGLFYINSESQRLIGYSFDELRGDDTLKHIYGANHEAIMGWLKALLRDEPLDETPNVQKIINRRGETLWLHYSCNVIELNGKPALLIVGTDVTAMQTAIEVLRQREEEFRALAENSPDFVMRFNSDHRLTYINPMVERIIGTRLKEIRGKPPSFLVRNPVNLADFERALTLVFETGEEQWVDLESRQQDGSSRFYEARIAPERDEYDNVVSALCISRDVTMNRRAEQAMRESEALFRQFAENFNDVLVIRDAATQKVMYVNPAFEDIWGRPTHPLLEDFNNYMGDIHPDDLHLIQGRIARQYHEPTEISYRINRPDGETRWLRSRTFPIYNDQGEIYRVGGLVEDFTKRRKMEGTLREQEVLLRQITENINEVLYISDFADKHIIYITDSCEAIWGYTADEIIADKDIILNAIHPDDRNETMHGYYEREDGQFGELEYRVIAKDGTVRWVRSRAFPVLDADGEIYRVTGIVEDITERKYLEEQALEKERLRTELDKEKEMRQLKEGLAAIVSHEFRTPLTVIMSSSELLVSYFDRLTPERREGHLDKIRQQTVYMTQLMEDILDFQRLDNFSRDSHAFDPVNLPTLCEEIINDLQTSNDTHEIIFEHEGDFDDALLDRKLLHHIINNLLGNAQKYSPESTTIRLAIKRTSNVVTISVEDQGIGIPEDQQKNLFQPFQRARNVGTRRGTGLGLAIVKQAVDALNGHIAIQSKEGEGSVFTVRLPVQGGA